MGCGGLCGVFEDALDIHSLLCRGVGAVLDLSGKDTTLPQLLEKAGIHYKACTNTHNPTTPTSPNT